MTAPVVGVAGLSHLGLVTAAAAAARGFAVVAFDDEARVARVRAGQPGLFEPGLTEALAEHRPRIALVDRPADLGHCDLVYVALDVATDNGGASDLGPLRDLVDAAAGAVPPPAPLVVLSQAPPGFTRTLPVAPERLYGQVETLVVGSAMARATAPERFIVGCADPADALPAPLSAYLGAFGCPVLRMSYESAELAKAAVNAYLAAAVSTTNTLAELCEAVGADWSDIAPALRLDPRIGPAAYLAPGLGLAGGNLERDLATLLRLAQETGTHDAVVRAFLDSSRHRRGWVLRQLHQLVLSHRDDAVVAILGLAYKVGTSSTRNSPALELLRWLHPFEVRLYDPVARPPAGAHPRMRDAASPLEACDGADAAVVMTPWPELAALAPGDVARRLRGTTVIDPYRTLDAGQCLASGLDHVILGAPPALATSAPGRPPC